MRYKLWTAAIACAVHVVTMLLFTRLLSLHSLTAQRSIVLVREWRASMTCTCINDLRVIDDVFCSPVLLWAGWAVRLIVPSVVLYKCRCCADLCSVYFCVAFVLYSVQQYYLSCTVYNMCTLFSAVWPVYCTVSLRVVVRCVQYCAHFSVCTLFGQCMYTVRTVYVHCAVLCESCAAH